MNSLDKQTMARLRQERKPQIAEAKERIKEQARVLKLIKGHLAQGPDTIMGIARATGLSPREALWFVTAMRKYGQAIEGEKRGGYFQYALSSGAPTAAEAGEDSQQSA